MIQKAQETIAVIMEEFRVNHPEYSESLQPHRLHYLEEVYSEVLRGEHVAKTDLELEDESRDAGIKRMEYEALINLVAHEAADSSK